MTRPLFIAWMITALILAGCQVDTAPQDVANFSTNRAASEEPAAYDGTYILYSDESTGAVPVLMKQHLKAGEIIGFEVDPSRVPFAVAGHERMKLAPGRYRWEMNPDPGQTDWNKTGVVVIEVVVVVVVVAVAVVTTILVTRAAHI